MARKNLKSTGAITPPHLPKTKPATALPDALPADNAFYANLVLSHASLTGVVALDVTFEEAHLQHVLLDASDLKALNLRDVRLDSCDLAQARWEKARLSRIEMHSCRLMGFKAIEARVEDALFTDCNCSYALFWSSTFRAVRFQSCDLTEASFQAADLRGVVFDRCDLRGADLQDARLEGADFRGSLVEGMRVGSADLRGAIIDPEQAMAFAALLGLVVRVEDGV